MVATEEIKEIEKSKGKEGENEILKLFFFFFLSPLAGVFYMSSGHFLSEKKNVSRVSTLYLLIVFEQNFNCGSLSKAKYEKTRNLAIFFSKSLTVV